MLAAGSLPIHDTGVFVQSLVSVLHAGGRATTTPRRATSNIEEEEGRQEAMGNNIMYRSTVLVLFVICQNAINGRDERRGWKSLMT